MQYLTFYSLCKTDHYRCIQNLFLPKHVCIGHAYINFKKKNIIISVASCFGCMSICVNFLSFSFFFSSKMWELWNKSVWMGTLEEQKEQKGICTGSRQEAVGVRYLLFLLSRLRCEWWDLHRCSGTRHSSLSLKLTVKLWLPQNAEDGLFVVGDWLDIKSLVSSLNHVCILALRGNRISSLPL